jgi:NAD(P)-dependent dehydrogenase (short-subunit alcohol dehydrogenase family)
MEGAAVKISDLFKVEGYGVVVTGGGSGIGLGYAEVLASNGARVTILDVHAQRIENETKRLRGAGLDVRGQVVDVTDHRALDAAVDEAVRAYGRLDVMFANAGIDPGAGFLGGWPGSERPRVFEGAFENYTDERWNRVIETNLNGVFATVRAAARHMKPAKSGRIIITTSLASTRVEPAIGAAYMAARPGLRIS